MSEDNNFSCRNSTTGNVSLALKQLNHCLIKRLQDGQSSTPAGALTRYLRILSKNFESGLSAFLRKLRRFRRSEPPIITGFSASSTLNFKWLTLLLPRSGPKAFSLKRAAYCSRLFVSVNTSKRDGDFKLSLSLRPLRGPCVGGGKVCASLRPL